MKISVVMSTYNGQKYILEQLDSLRNQTRQADEVLIFDDRSTDATATLVADYIKKYALNGWQIKVNPQNKGWRRNFMEGMWSATGDIIFTCDQDDIWRSDKLAVMAKIMGKHPEIQLLTSNYCEFFDNGKRRVGPNSNTKELKKILLKNNYLLVGQPGCTHCIRKSLIEVSKKYWQPEYPHDALLWRLAIFADSLYTYTDDLIAWRKHATSAFAKESRDLKTVKEKKKWIATAQKFDKTLCQYIKEDVASDTTKQERVLSRNDKWLAEREKFYQTKNILCGIWLARYWDCYPRYRQYPAEWYLLFIKRK